MNSDPEQKKATLEDEKRDIDRLFEQDDEDPFADPDFWEEDVKKDPPKKPKKDNDGKSLLFL